MCHIAMQAGGPSPDLPGPPTVIFQQTVQLSNALAATLFMDFQRVHLKKINIHRVFNTTGPSILFDTKVSRTAAHFPPHPLKIYKSRRPINLKMYWSCAPRTPPAPENVFDKNPASCLV